MTDVVIFIPSKDSPENGGKEGPLSYGKAWYQRVIDELEARQIPYVLIEDAVTRKKLEDAIKKHDPNLVLGFGHGYSNILLGDFSEMFYNYPVIMAKPGRADTARISTPLDNVDILSNSVFYSLSCNLGKELLPEAVREDATSAAGYDDEYIWLVTEGVEPARDPRAEPFGIAGTEFALALVQGESVERAKERTVQKFDELIQKYEGGNLYSREMVKWLMWNRDHFTTFGEGGVQPVELREIIRQAVVSEKLVWGGLGLFLFGLSYREYKRRKQGENE